MKYRLQLEIIERVGEMCEILKRERHTHTHVHPRAGAPSDIVVAPHATAACYVQQQKKVDKKFASKDSRRLSPRENS